MAHLTALLAIQIRRSAHLYNEMTQTSSAIIVAIKPPWNMPNCA
jgi:hypothetical protein